MAHDPQVFAAGIPELYDRHLGPVFMDPYAEDLAARVAEGPANHVIELACGTGVVTRRLIARLPAGVRITATDLNPDMLKIAGQRVAPAPGLSWRQADAMNLPFEDGSADQVVCQFGVMFFPDKRQAAAEVRRVLKPGGTYLFNVWGSLADNPCARIAHNTIAGFFPGDPPRFYLTPFGYHDEAAIRADLEASGFRGVDIETVDRPAISVSAQDFATGLVRGNPVVDAIKERGTAGVDTVEAAVTRGLAEEGGARPYRSTLRALVVRATT